MDTDCPNFYRLGDIFRYRWVGGLAVKKDNEIRALRNQRDNLQLEIKTMKLYELAVIRKLLVDKEITFPTKSTPNGFRDSLRNLVKVEYYEDDAPHQFPTNSTETLKKYETS